MKEKWIEEQMEVYRKLDIKSLKNKLIEDLKDAVKWLESEDYDTTYRLVGGITKALKENESKIF